MELKGCAAIVTGGSGGLGQRICRALALNGVNLVVNYAESKAKAESVAQEVGNMGVRAIAIQADVTDPDAVERMVMETEAAFGRIDILVNDAAFNKTIAYPDLDGLTHELWNHILSTNLTGAFNCIKAVAPLMTARGHGRSGAARQQHRLCGFQGRHHPSDEMHGGRTGARRDSKLRGARIHGRNAHECKSASRIRRDCCRYDAASPRG